MEKYFGFHEDEKVDKTIFVMKYNESGKVIDYCKSQQWQVVVIIIGFMFAIASLYIQWVNTFSQPKESLGFILNIHGYCIILIYIAWSCGLHLLMRLNKTIKRHNFYIDALKKYFDVPKELSESPYEEKTRRVNNSYFYWFFQMAIFISGVVTVYLTFIDI